MGADSGLTGTAFERRSRIEAPSDMVFDWHARPGAFERLTPPWETVEVTDRNGTIRDGDRLEMRVGRRPLRVRWVAEHEGYEAGSEFTDVQISGPFRSWRHSHRMRPLDGDACELSDRIDYRLPFGPLGRLLGGRAVDNRLRRMFDYRHRVTSGDLAAHHRHDRGGSGRLGGRPMKVLLSGATGLVGSALVSFLTTGGHQVVRLVRRPAVSEDEITWDPATGATLDLSRLEGLDAVVHLAGENIASGRWSPRTKARIRDSRVVGTELISSAIAGMPDPPAALICASAIGYYGDRGDTELTEASPPGTGFLADVCARWEAAADPARAAGVRVVHLRSGIVLSPRGGSLAKMLVPFRLGLGGRIGPGSQYMSWLTVDDAVGMVLHALDHDSVEGPVNAVAPRPVTNLEFTKILGRVLRRPTALPVPRPAIRLALGEMADELLLSSTRVIPAALEASDYPFSHRHLEDGLRHLLGRRPPSDRIA